jgi:hypothetical protein
LKLVVFGADGHEVAAMFVQGSVTYDEEETTFIAVAEDGHTVGELFVDETVGYDENTDAFVIRTAQWSPVLCGAAGVGWGIGWMSANEDNHP